MCWMPGRLSRLSFGVSIDRGEVRSTGSSIGWRLSQTQLVLCVTTMRQAKATIGTLATRYKFVDPEILLAGFGMMLRHGEVKIKCRAQAAFTGRKQGARISFATPELLFRVMMAIRTA
jgi:hypothetical protein